MIVKEIINSSVKACEEAGIYSGFARFLMLELLREKDLDMYLLMDEDLDENIHEDYNKKMARILENEPMGYVLGYQWFFGYKIGVNEDVLIPREETEELIGNILTEIDMFYPNPTIVDVATGSGAIALTLSKELNLPVIATDISKGALKQAERNAKYLDANVTFYQGDMLEPLIEKEMKFDVLVCNPPYIKNTEHIQSSVLEFEPHVALFGGDDGLFFYRKVLQDAHKVLNENGMIAFEIGFDIGEAVVDLSKQYFPQKKVKLLKDINGLDRMVLITPKTERLYKDEVNRVVEILKDDGIVAIPTDTVYGLAVRSDQESLYEKLKTVKERPENKPFPLMVSSIEQLESIVEMTDFTRHMVKTFMPGAITFIFKKKEDVFPYLNDQKTLGVRIADDAWVHEVIDKLGVAVWLPSANKSEAPVGTTSDVVLSQLDNDIDAVVLGESASKPSSTVVDISEDEIIILREGPISKETLEKEAHKYLENL